MEKEQKKSHIEKKHVDVLKAEMVTYFSKSGMTNEHIFSFMTKSKSWPDVNKVGPRSSLLNHISVPVVILLTNLVEYTNKILLAGYFVSTGVSSNDFSSWISPLPTPSSSLGSVGRPSKPSSND